MSTSPSRSPIEPAHTPVSVPRSGSEGGVELHEAGRRILGQYWWLIAILVVIGALMAAVSRVGGTTYTATARVVLDTPDPTQRQQAQAAADTVKALATSPQVVQAAIRAAGLTGRRDPIDVASNHVAVSGLGSSALANISVSDSNRYFATSIVNALAARVITVRTDQTSGGDQLNALGKRIDELSLGISNADATIDALNVDIANAGSATAANALRAKRDAASRQRDFLAQQRGVFETERVTILGNLALRSKASVISRAALPKHADSSGWLPYLILGGILGLILGVGIAAVLEMIRPTVVGGDAIARELDLPHLGELRGGVDHAYDAGDLAPIYERLQLAARAFGVRELGLFATRSGADVRGLAHRLSALAERRTARADIRAFTLASAPTLDERSSVGLVLVAPSLMKKASTAEINDLLRLTPSPVLGLITYQAERRLGRRIPEREPEVVAAGPSI
jgi:capsular polysaccharide biosynthesis protein